MLKSVHFLAMQNFGNLMYPDPDRKSGFLISNRTKTVVSRKILEIRKIVFQNEGSNLKEESRTTRKRGLKLKKSDKNFFNLWIYSFCHNLHGLLPDVCILCK